MSFQWAPPGPVPTCSAELDIPGVDLKVCRVAAKIVAVGQGDLACKVNQRFEFGGKFELSAIPG